jgi:hypothetical protein
MMEIHLDPRPNNGDGRCDREAKAPSISFSALTATSATSSSLAYDASRGEAYQAYGVLDEGHLEAGTAPDEPKLLQVRPRGSDVTTLFSIIYRPCDHSHSW